MEKLEFKDLASYLPYKLKFNHFDDEREINSICEFFQINEEEISLSNNEYEYVYSISDYSVEPILRRLSDLTKEIEHNGEKFVPILRLAELNLRQFNWKMIFDSKRAFSDKLNVEFYFNGKDFRCVNQQYDAVAQNQFILFQKLFEWHFDVFGLIEKGLAVDINTLDNG